MVSVCTGLRGEEDCVNISVDTRLKPNTFWYEDSFFLKNKAQKQVKIFQSQKIQNTKNKYCRTRNSRVSQVKQIGEFCIIAYLYISVSLP